MVNRYYGYQYDTNPRKLSQDTTPIRNRYSRNNENKQTEKYQDNDDNDSYLFEINNRKKKQAENKQQTAKRVVQEKKDNIVEKAKEAKTDKKNIKAKLKIVMFIIAGFSVLFAVSYQNSLINESFNKKEKYKAEAEALSKTNKQLEVSIENSLNLNNIEQIAKEKLGMQKLGNNQKVYISLPKQDYVVPAGEQVVIEEEQNLFTKIVNFFVK